jgi:hypothetical protein
MSEILCYQHGLYPRSEDLVAATRDLDRGRRPATAVIDQRESDSTGAPVAGRDPARLP